MPPSATAIPTLPLDLQSARPMDCSDRRGAYLVRSRNGGWVRLSPSSLALLKAVQGGSSFEQLAAAQKQAGAAHSADDLERAYRRLHRQLRDMAANPQASIPGLRACRPLLSAKTTGLLCRPLSWLFSPWMVLLALLAASSLWLRLPAASLKELEPLHLAAALALFVLSCFWHELGHAAALRRYGGRPGEIGCGLYWIYPAFYAEVSDTWRLGRRQRVVVDLAGIYLQLLFGALLSLLDLCWGCACLAAACWLILPAALLALNPLLRLDGYWALADALGVSNLSSAGRDALARWQQRRRDSARQQLPWPTWVWTVLVLYRPLSALLGLSLLCLLLMTAWSSIAALGAYPRTAFDSPAATLRLLLSALSLTLLSAGLWNRGKAWLRRLTALRSTTTA